MKKSIIVFALALSFFLCATVGAQALDTAPATLLGASNTQTPQDSRALTSGVDGENVFVVYMPLNMEGYKVTAITDGMLVERGGSYEFRIELLEGYSYSKSFAVSVNGKKLTGDKNGVYTISSISEDCIISVDGVVDTTPPKVTLKIGEYSFADIPESTDGFLYINTRPEIIVDVKDEGSKVASVMVAISSFELSVDQLSSYAYWQKYTDKMTLSADGANFVYVKVIDEGGNTTLVGSAGIVSDTSFPVINADNGATYYGAKSIKISDDYLDSVTLDGKKATPLFTLVPRDEDYVIVARDKAGNEARVKISVKRAMPVYTAPTDLTAIVGQTLADVKLPATENGSFVWSLPLSTSVGELGENKFSVTFIPSNTADYQTVTGIEVIIKVTNKAHTSPVGITSVGESIKGIADGKIVGVSSDMEYRAEGDSEWIKINGTEITGLAGGTYFVRYSASTGYEASPFVDVTVQSGRMLKVTFRADGETVALIECAYGQALADIPAVPVKMGYNHSTPYWDVSDFSFITEDMTVNAVYTTNTYFITFTESTRYTIVEGGVKSPVEYGSNYTFTIDIADDYMEGIYFTVKNNGTLIFPDENGVYTIENVTEVHAIEVSGVVLNVSHEKNTVVGIDADKHYAIGDKLTFTAIGSGMSNEEPEIGDERYVPLSWSAYLNSRWDEAPYKASFTLYKQGECEVKVVYRHEIYSASGWVPYGENAESIYTVTVHKLPYGIPTGNITLSTVVCIVLIATFTGVFVAWSVVKKKREGQSDDEQ